MARTIWPDRLTEITATQRVQSILINLAEGRRNIAEDREYVELRKLLRRQTQYKKLMPSVIDAHKSLDSFSAFIREIDSRSLRTEMIRSEFRPLLEAMAQNALEPIDASSWTGRPTKGQQAIIVKNVSRRAMEAIDLLIEDHERRHDNGGPVSVEEAGNLALLRELRGEIDQLIRLVEADQPYTVRAGRLAAIGKRALDGFAESMRKDVTAVTGSATAVTVAATTYALSQMLFGLSDETALAFGGFALTGHVAARWKAS